MKLVLQLEHIQKYYGNEGNITQAIKDISFSVGQGEFLGIMGASGSGKTTLLNCISTIDTVSAGHIYLDGSEPQDGGDDPDGDSRCLLGQLCRPDPVSKGRRDLYRNTQRKRHKKNLL